MMTRRPARLLPFFAALTVAATLLLSAPGHAQADRDAAIQGVISAQIDAFRVDDFVRAFTFASPTIQGIFGTPERFGAMVRQGYPMVWRPSSVRFGDVLQSSGRIVQPVYLTDAAGALYVADYEMINVDGAWQINGVTLRRPEALGA
ncbi:MAG: DUF4864 domain-containing protein [Pseudomonadota bacterium]